MSVVRSVRFGSLQCICMCVVLQGREEGEVRRIRILVRNGVIIHVFRFSFSFCVVCVVCVKKVVVGFMQKVRCILGV